MVNRTTFDRNDGDNLKVNFKEYFEKLIDLSERNIFSKIDALEKTVLVQIKSQKDVADTAFSASQLAITKSEESQKAYNEKSNEFRSSIDDITKQNITKNEYDAGHKSLVERVDRQNQNLNEKISQLDTRLSDFILKTQKDFEELRLFRGDTVSKSEQSKSDRAFVFSVISLIGTTVAILLALLKLFGY